MLPRYEYGDLLTGLDLSDPEDRATLRLRCEQRFASTKLSSIQGRARELGATDVGTSRSDATRALADALIGGLS